MKLDGHRRAYLEALQGAADALAALGALRPRPLVALGGQPWRGEAAREAQALGADLVLEGRASSSRTCASGSPR